MVIEVYMVEANTVVEVIVTKVVDIATGQDDTMIVDNLWWWRTPTKNNKVVNKIKVLEVTMVVEVTKIVDNTMGEDNTKEVNKTKVVYNNYYGRQHQVGGGHDI